jgi:hypothetical protein
VVVGQTFGWAVAGHILAFGAGIGAHRAYLWWRRR